MSAVPQARRRLPGSRAVRPDGLPDRVDIIGAGLIGTSLGLALTACQVDVVLRDLQPSAVDCAVALGAGSRAEDLASFPPQVIVVAAPPDAVAEVVAENLRAYPKAIVTDVASVKMGVYQRLRELVADERELARYIGGHPLAGRERSGAAAAQAELFAGRPWVLTPTGPMSDPALIMLRNTIEATGAVVTELTHAEHDAAVAVISHAPQVMASLVAAQLGQASQTAVALAGQGVRDVTRIAASDSGLWTQILAANAISVGHTLRELRGDLEEMISALDQVAQDPSRATPAARARIEQVLSRGRAGQSRIPGKHGGQAQSYLVVAVAVPDVPGSLARLMSDVGAANINIEDLRLEHSERRPMALAEISVLAEAADPLAQELLARGWTVHR